MRRRRGKRRAENMCLYAVSNLFSSSSITGRPQYSWEHKYSNKELIRPIIHVVRFLCCCSYVALPSCTELVCARANLNYANFRCRCKFAALPSPLRFFCTNIHISSSVKRCTFWKLRLNCRSSFMFKTYLLVINVNLQRKLASAHTKGILAGKAAQQSCTWLHHRCYGLAGLRIKCGVYLPG